jgi:glycosyltransferase involved in cell wall biosynthesis
VVRDGVEGFLVAPRDVEALMARIELLYRDPARRADMAQAARRRAEDFTWAAYRRRLADFFDGLSSASSLSK